MLRASSILAAGSWSGVPADRVELTYDDRHRRRIGMRGDAGLQFLLDLAEAVILRHGDGLVLEDGRLVEVRAKPESLLEVRGRNAHHLARLAWHLGNRHLPAAIERERILIRPDHVIAGMLSGLGASVREVELPFDPEGGAYSAGHGGHDASHAHPVGHDYDSHG